MMKFFPILFLLATCDLVAQSSSARFLIGGAWGLMESPRQGAYPFQSIGLTIIKEGGRTLAVRYAAGSREDWPEDDPEYWDYRELSVLAGIRKEKRHGNAFIAGGLAITEQKYSAEYPEGPLSPYTKTKIGLSYEAGLTFVPVKFFGLGLKLLGQFRPPGWTTTGYVLFLELGGVGRPR